MAAANVLTTGTTATSSSDSTIAAATLYGLKGADADAKVFIELKDDGGAYNVIGLLSRSEPAKLLYPGTYRFRRPAGPSCGVFTA